MCGFLFSIFEQESYCTTPGMLQFRYQLVISSVTWEMKNYALEPPEFLHLLCSSCFHFIMSGSASRRGLQEDAHI